MQTFIQSLLGSTTNAWDREVWQGLPKASEGEAPAEGTGYKRDTSPASRPSQEQRGEKKTGGGEEGRRKVVVKRPDRKCTWGPGE